MRACCVAVVFTLTSAANATPERAAAERARPGHDGQGRAARESATKKPLPKPNIHHHAPRVGERESSSEACGSKDLSNVSFEEGAVGRLQGALLERSDCCLTIGVVGGSVPCGGRDGPTSPGFHPRGSRLMKTGSRGGGPSGPVDAWPAILERVLNKPYSACCRRGHRVLNLCQSGAGSAFFVETFDTRIAAPLAAAGGADLIVVDSATNDFHEALYRLKHYTEAKIREVKGEAPMNIEALLRRLLSLRPQPQVLYLQTAWFDDRPGWAAQLPVLKHYGVPGLHVPLALQMERALTRECFLGDTTHPGVEGHVLIAKAVLWQLEATLPPWFNNASLHMEVVADFTSAVTLSLLEGLTGWRLGVQRKMEDGSYELLPPESALALGGGKAGLYAMAPHAAFELQARFWHGKLRVGYLRSWDAAMGKVEVSVRRTSRSPWECAGELDGRWTETTSVYSQTTLRLPFKDTIAQNSIMTVRFQLQEKPHSGSPAPPVPRFVVYTIAVM